LIGYADAMRQEVFGPLPPPYDAHAAVILEAAGRLLALVDDMTDIAAAEAGIWSAPHERFDAGALAQDTLRLFARRAAEAGVRTRADIEGPSLDVIADRRALGQILTNLWDNALKFAAPGGEAAVTVRKAGCELRLEVTDTGPRLPGANGAGRGLGLRLVEALCAAHGGTLNLERPGDGGFSATVRLPILAGD
jgi:cell cycle sensor histidine kinase DivJ